MRQYILGLHEPGGERLMEAYPGFLLFTHELGRDPSNMTGFNYAAWSDRGFQVIARLNHGYFPNGTIPEPAYYADFAQRVQNFVASSFGCKRWIIGNEPNHEQEWPAGVPIVPSQYAVCYNLCADAILSIDPGAIVIPAPVAPWNVQTAYEGNPSGDWLRYFQDQLNGCLETLIGGLALHTYTHGSDPALIVSEQTMDPPYQDRRYHFRAYRDFLAWVPDWLKNRPVYITETNQNGPWLNEPNTWIQAAMQEVNAWNQAGRQVIEACVCYRWPRYDQWYMQGLGHVETDFQEAANLGYYVQIGDEPMPEPQEVLVNGNMDYPFNAQIDQNGHPMQTIKVPYGWRAFWIDHMPEYKSVEEIYTNRIESPPTAAQWFANYARPNGGLYQVVPTVSGKRYRLTGWGQLWCVYQNGNDVPASLETRVNLYGSTNIDDPRNLRSNPIHPHNQWLQFNPLEFTAASDQTTVFIFGVFVDPGRDMNAYVDSFSLVCLDCEDGGIPPIEPPPSGGGECDPISSGAAGLALATAQSLVALAGAASQAAGYFEALLDEWLPEPKPTLLQRIKAMFTRKSFDG